MFSFKQLSNFYILQIFFQRILSTLVSLLRLYFLNLQSRASGKLLFRLHLPLDGHIVSSNYMAISAYEWRLYRFGHFADSEVCHGGLYRDKAFLMAGYDDATFTVPYLRVFCLCGRTGLWIRLWRSEVRRTCSAAFQQCLKGCRAPGEPDAKDRSIHYDAEEIPAGKRCPHPPR